MNQYELLYSTMLRRERFRDWYLLNKDPIFNHRLLWQAHGFRHMVHLLPGETILELGSGQGYFTQCLVETSKGRNPITAVRFDSEILPQETDSETVENIVLSSFPDQLEGRKFNYVVGQNILDKNDTSLLLNLVYEILEDGGRAILFESNPWNPAFAIKTVCRKISGKSLTQSLVSQPKLYELISEIGFIRVSALFTDFVYAPLTRTLIWLLRNLSILLENTPGVRKFAGQILIHAQKPPRDIERKKCSFFRHEELRDSFSVVVPCFNEEMNVGSLVEGLCGYYDEYIHQIILINDNSTDKTREVIEKLSGKDPRIILIDREKPNGVGRALKDGYANATGTYVLSMDCDFQHVLPELEDMFDAVAEGADVVMGSRFSRHSLLINYPFTKIVANRTFHLLANIIFRRSWRDVTNNLKIFRTERLGDLVLSEPWFAFNAEIGLQLMLIGKSVKEVPISWINRTFDMGQSKFQVFQSGGGYARVLFRLAWQTRFGTKAVNQG